MMVNKTIQMKHSNNGEWDNLYPVTLTENVYDNDGVSIETKVNNINDLVIEKISKLQDEKVSLNIDKAKNQYLFDLELDKRTINQGLCVDEINQHIYASQAFNIEGDPFESFYINRLTMGGKLLDSMLIRFGGHGTSFGVEVEDGVPYIWSNIQQVNGEVRETQWLVRFPYVPNTEINAFSPSVEKIEEYPNPHIYQTPIIDNKNGLIGIRKTTVSTKEKTSIEVRKISNVKQNIHDNEYVFNFTSEMNGLVLQGMHLDGEIGYFTFGYNVNEFKLFEVNLKKDEIIKIYNANDLDLVGSKERYENNISEPEGLYLYTDPKTQQKTLLHVIVSSAANRRRNRLYAISSNSGVNKFLGFSIENTQQIPITLNNGKGKTIDPSIIKLSDVNIPGNYYITQNESNSFEDFPLKDVAGWWFFVSAQDNGGGVFQTLRRNSAYHTTEFKRNVTGDGVPTEWEGLPIKPTFQNGFENYNDSDKARIVEYTKIGNTLYINGVVKAPNNLPLDVPIFTLPVGYRPLKRYAFPVVSSNGIVELTVNYNGVVTITGYLTDNIDPSYIYINCSVILN